jgi:hypothetical protein
MTGEVARSVPPWRWIRALRDDGPRSLRFFCAMLTLNTWMNSEGCAWPTLRTWAKGSRMAIGTLCKQRDEAIKLGWLDVHAQGEARHGQGWRCATYHCTVPSAQNQSGEAVPRKSDTPSTIFARERCSTHGDTPSAVDKSQVCTRKVSQIDPEAVSKSGQAVSTRVTPIFQSELPIRTSNSDARARDPVDNSNGQTPSDINIASPKERSTGNGKAKPTRPRYSERTAVMELSAEAKQIGFRPIGRTEDVKAYAAALKSHKNRSPPKKVIARIMVSRPNARRRAT